MRSRCSTASLPPRGASGRDAGHGERPWHEIGASGHDPGRLGSDARGGPKQPPSPARSAVFLPYRHHMTLRRVFGPLQARIELGQQPSERVIDAQGTPSALDGGLSVTRCRCGREPADEGPGRPEILSSVQGVHLGAAWTVATELGCVGLSVDRAFARNESARSGRSGPRYRSQGARGAHLSGSGAAIGPVVVRAS
jgi:hypothetical protein